MAEEGLKQKAVKGAAWQLGNLFITQGAQLVISIVLARLIMPSQFGIIAMFAVFNSIAGVLIDSGFAKALVRKTDRTDVDCSSMFYFNIAVAITCYIILFLCAPFIARFYNMAELTPIIRVASISLVISSFGAIQGTMFQISLNFKILSICSMISMISSGIIGIILAYLDWQVWALVSQMVLGAFFSTLLLWLFSSWRPRLTFSMSSIKEMFSFGSKLLASALLDKVYGQLYSITIGKFYNAANLGYYSRSNALASFVATTPSGILNSVSYPALCKMQHDDEYLARGYRKFLRVTAFIVFPLSLGLSAAAYPLINVVYTAKWMSAAPLLQILCFALMWWPIHAINLNLLQVKGRSDLFLRLEIIKKIIGFTVLCSTLPFGITTMCYGMIVNSIISLFINTYYTGKLIHLGFWQQMKDILPSLLLSLVMWGIVHFITRMLGNGGISLSTGIIAGAAFFILTATLLRLPEVTEVKNIVKSFIHH